MRTGAEGKEQMMFERLEQLAKRELSDGEISAIGKALPMMLRIPKEMNVSERGCFSAP